MKLKARSLLVLVMAFHGSIMTGMAYETAPYEQVFEHDSFSIRHYPSLLVAEVRAEDGEGANRHFNKLFRFISGANQEEQKIAMTTPVFMDGKFMQFVLPAEINPDAPPQPLDPSVQVRQTEPVMVAVHRFRGLRSERNESRALATLLDWLAKEGRESAGEPFFAYYNSPWTPGFLRRNEVMIRLVDSSSD